MEIPIVFITDNNFALPTGVAITSLILNKKPETIYKIHVIVTNDVTIENKEKLLSCGNKNDTIELINFDVSIIEKYRKPDHSVPPCGLLKFNIPSLLPQYEKMIYLDGDILTKGDLSDFFAIDLSNSYLGAISDFPAIKWEFSHKRLYLKDYFNSGVLLLNIKRMIEDNFEELAYNIKNENIDFLYMDQDALNFATRDNVVFCHVKYNAMLCIYKLCFEYDISEFNMLYNTLYDSYDDLYNDAVIIHLPSIKPWKHKEALYHEEWMKYFEKSPFRNQDLLLDYFYRNNNDKNEIEVYVAGESITLKNNLSQYQYNGWSIPEDWGTWTEREYAGLVMNVDSNSDLLLYLNISSIFNNNPVEVYVNDVLLDSFKFIIGINKIHIPKRLYPDNNLMIQFVFKDLKTPQVLGISDDTRKLGIGISSFFIKEFDN